MTSSTAPVTAGGESNSVDGICFEVSATKAIAFWAQTSSDPLSTSCRAGMEPFFWAKAICVSGAIIVLASRIWAFVVSAFFDFGNANTSPPIT